MLTLFILKMGRFQTFRDGALRSGNCGQGSGGKKAATTENSHRVKPGCSGRPEDRGGVLGVQHHRAVHQPACRVQFQKVPEGYRRVGGDAFSGENHTSRGLRTNSPSDIKAQETKKKKGKKQSTGDCGRQNI